MDWAKTTARQDKNHFSFGIWLHLILSCSTLLVYLTFTHICHINHQCSLLLLTKAGHAYVRDNLSLDKTWCIPFEGSTSATIMYSPSAVTGICIPFCTDKQDTVWYRAHSRFAPSQWEMALLSNKVSHWLSASLESALWYHYNVVNFIQTHKGYPIAHPLRQGIGYVLWV